MPLLAEAMRALEEGIGTAEDIDTGARVGLNHPMGPLELADFIGLDVVPRHHARPPRRPRRRAVPAAARAGGARRRRDSWARRPAPASSPIREPEAAPVLLDAFAGLDPETRLLGETVRDFARRGRRAGRDRARRGGAVRPRAGDPDGRAGAARGARSPRPSAAPGCRAVAWTVVIEEIAAADMALAVTLCVHVLHQNPVVRWGSEEQKARWLPALQAGEALGAFALTEPEAGSNAAAIRMRAERVGPADAPEGYRLTGTKIWISNAPEAERYLVFATLDPARGPDGDHRVPRGEGDAGLRLRRPREEDGDPQLPGGRARLRGRRGSRGATASAARARAIASHSPPSATAGSGSPRHARVSPGRRWSRPRRYLGGAHGLRRADRRAAGAPLHDRRDGARGGRGAGPHPRGGRDARPWRRGRGGRDRRRRSRNGPRRTPRCG